MSAMTDPAGVTTYYEHDILGRISRIHSGQGMEVKYAYDCLNRLTQVFYGNGVETCYKYDACGNLSSLNTTADGSTLLSFTYEYDGNGNRISKAGEQRLVSGGTSLLDIGYAYDVRGRLLEEKRNGKSSLYTYDAAGNRIRKESPEGTSIYCYNEKNQMVSKEGIRGKKAFTYSRQGSILKEEGMSGTRRFRYNSKNQQTRVESEDGRVQENLYDAEGLRCGIREDGQFIRFVYHSGELLYEGGDNNQTSYHLGAGIEAFQKGGETYYYHQDEQLSTALVTGQTGESRNHYQYDAFGNELEKEEQLANRIRYTGQQYDQVTEQYYLRARYYNPLLGRFMQEDVYQGDGLNLYAYCGNNPVMYYDPSGYAEEYEDAKIEGGQGNDGTENKKSFFTVQSEEDAMRLMQGGEPWPSKDTRAALGEGVYSWGTRADAERYYELIKGSNPEVCIVEFTIKEDDLLNLNSLNINMLTDSEAEKFMQQYSKLWGGTPNHGYDYIIRGTNIGDEHFFSKLIIKLLEFLDWKK